MKKQTKQKKETILSVLKDIRALLKANIGEKPTESLISAIDKQKFTENNGKVRMYFPSITAKEIRTQSENKISKGTPLLYADAGDAWYENEPFFTTEKTRPGFKTIDLDLIGKGKNWNDCEALIKEKGGEMLNFTETLYLVWQYEKQTGRRLLENEYVWTASQTADRVRFASFGLFDDRGARVSCFFPRLEWDEPGVLFSCSEKLKD